MPRCQRLIPIAMATGLNSRINSLAELVSAAKAKPGELSYSSGGIGSSSHMATEQFAAAAGIQDKAGAEVAGMPAAKLRLHIRQETDDFNKIANEANIRVE